MPSQRTLAPLLVLLLAPTPAAAEKNIDRPPPAPEPHHVRIGFAMDSVLQAVDANGNVRQPFADAVQTLTDDGLVAPNGLPDLTINRVTSAAWPALDVEPAASSAFLLGPVLTRANVMVGMEDLPYDPWASGSETCADVTSTFEPDIYGDWGIANACDAYSYYGGPTTPPPGEAENRLPPVFSSFGVPFGPFQYATWVEELAALLPSGSPGGELSFETGNEPDGKRFFWGNAAEYLDKADAIYDGVRAADAALGRTSPIFFGGYGGSTVMDLGKVDPTPPYQTAWDDFRDAIDQRANPADPDHGFSFHLFRNPFGGAYDPVDNEMGWEKSWDDLRASTAFPGASADRIVLSAFDLFGTVSFGYKRSLKQSSWLTWELAELLLFAQEREIEQIHLWKLVDRCGRAPTGYFDATGQPTAAYEHLLAVWEVIENGYVATDLGDGIEIRGDQLILRTWDTGSHPWTDDMLVHSCKTNDLGPISDAGWRVPVIEAAWADMGWVIYEETTPGTGLPCLAISSLPPIPVLSSDDTGCTPPTLPGPPGDGGDPERR